MIGRLKEKRGNGQFEGYHIEIEDLQELRRLEERKKLSKGELSSLVFAKRTNQAFLTDDQSARKLAENIIPRKMVQTTPHLLGWLIFQGYLSDNYIPGIINEHTEMGRPLKNFFEEMYIRAMECKLAHEC